MRKAWFISITLVTAAIPVAADQTAVTPPATAQFGAQRPPQSSNPYARLFEAREALKQAVQSQPFKSAPKKKIVCGMTIIEVGPELDPKMGVTPPKDDKVRYTIRAIDPPICNPAR